MQKSKAVPVVPEPILDTFAPQHTWSTFLKSMGGHPGTQQGFDERRAPSRREGEHHFSNSIPPNRTDSLPLARTPFAQPPAEGVLEEVGEERGLDERVEEALRMESTRVKMGMIDLILM